MLSYMLPVDDKPPPAPPKGHLQLSLSGGGGGEPVANGGGRASSTPISKETSVSSFASDLTTATASHSSMTPTSTSDKGKPKLMINGKHPTLKRFVYDFCFGIFVITETSQKRLEPGIGKLFL